MLTGSENRGLRLGEPGSFHRTNRRICNIATEMPGAGLVFFLSCIFCISGMSRTCSWQNGTSCVRPADVHLRNAFSKTLSRASYFSLDYSKYRRGYCSSREVQGAFHSCAPTPPPTCKWDSYCCMTTAAAYPGKTWRTKRFTWLNPA